MNVKRGLFRIWVALSLLFIAGVTALAWSPIRAEFHNAAFLGTVRTIDYKVPVKCAEARGSEGTDFEIAQFANRAPGTVCEYPIPKFRALYPEYDAVPEYEMLQSTYRKFGEDVLPNMEFKPWEMLGYYASIAVSLPLICFLVGALGFWVTAGFRRDRPEAR